MTWSRTNRLIADAAQRLGARAEPLSRDPTDFFMRLRHPRGSVLISKTRSPFLTQVAQTLSNNKHVSRERLLAAGIPVVEDLLVDEGVDRGDPGVEAFLARHPAVVVKPNWGNRGVGVGLDLREEVSVWRAIDHARGLDRDEEALVEPFLPGTNIRLTVIGGRFEAGAEVRRPRLEADGRRSLRELVEALNHDPRRADWRRPQLVSMDRVDPDEILESVVAARGWIPSTVLPPGAVVDLAGEESEVIDITDRVPPIWRELAVRACACLGVDVGGVDVRGRLEAFVTGDADASPRVLEVNVLPALHLHALPTQGVPRPVFEAFVAYCLQLPGAPPPGGGPPA